MSVKFDNFLGRELIIPDDRLYDPAEGLWIKEQEIVKTMDPLEAAAEIADAAKELFSLLGDEALRNFLTRMIGDEGNDKITGLVHL